MKIRFFLSAIVLGGVMAAAPVLADAKVYTVYNNSDAAVWVEAKFGFTTSGFCTNPQSKNSKDIIGVIDEVRIEHKNCKHPIITKKRVGSYEYPKVFVDGYNGHYTINLGR